VPSLVAKNGPLAGQRLEIDRELTIGRLNADVVVEDSELSRQHAVFRYTDGVLEVEDLGSTNGTFVEGRRIDGPTRVDNGQKVKIGISLFVADVEIPVQATQVREVPTGGETRIATAAPAEEGATVLRPAEQTPAPVAAAPPPAAAAPAAPVEPVPPPAKAAAPPPAAAAAPAAPAGVPAAVGQFAPPAARRGGLATRSWLPVALSYGSVIAAAAALVIYFASR